jgi:hypothetical protein
MYPQWQFRTMIPLGVLTAHKEGWSRGLSFPISDAL